ncbi:TniB family NTP-binding protein [Streptomyces sp. NPDC093795]|uniref:TniB family NTP-binding protein n=1 Tax=Streptomyces sp. NPDC093795 TaxID=3366051 RepID=UPI00381858DD
MVNPIPQNVSGAPVETVGSGGAELSWPLTTWRGWHRFATTDPPAPPQRGDPPRSTEERLAYHSSFVTIRTPAIHNLATQVRTLMILGRHQQTTARPSLIVTGPAAAGKTTALLNVGRTCHLAHTRKIPPPTGSAHAAVPVVYVLVPPGATAKTLITEFARYLGIPITARMTQTQITDAVCHTYTQAGVQLLVVCSALNWVDCRLGCQHQSWTGSGEGSVHLPVAEASTRPCSDASPYVRGIQSPSVTATQTLVRSNEVPRAESKDFALFPATR